jgi:hypothetical protein
MKLSKVSFITAVRVDKLGLRNAFFEDEGDISLDGVFVQIKWKAQPTIVIPLSNVASMVPAEKKTVAKEVK